MSDSEKGAAILDALYQVIESRKGDDPEASYSARLLADGPAKAGQKVGEEALETIIAALEEDQAALARESADLLYHLLVLWATRDLKPELVWEELARRQGTSGLAEKASRKG